MPPAPPTARGFGDDWAADKLQGWMRLGMGSRRRGGYRLDMWCRAERAALVARVLAACARPDPPPSPLAPPPIAVAPSGSRPAPRASTSDRAAPVDSAPARTLTRAWRPPAGSPREYAASDPEDQHQIVLTRGVMRGGRYPALIAFHGQPRAGQAPRDYAFVRTVKQLTLDLVDRGELEPLVVILPVFRFVGENWPKFDLVAFWQDVTRRLEDEGITVTDRWLCGHSAAAGCGGRGLNEAHRIHPALVGFFDTCVGPGFGREIRELQREHVPTLIVHSVETAGFRPRPPTEYLSSFDFGQVYRPLGLRPDAGCPARLPDAPLRSQSYRCALDAEGTTRALVVDTGEGQAGHDALLPVALRYFLREFAHSHSSTPSRP